MHARRRAPQTRLRARHASWRCAGKTLPGSDRFIDGLIGPAIDDDAALVAP